MFRKLIFIPAFLFSLNASTQTTSPGCSDPFAGERTQFTLTEPISCDSPQSKYQLQISSGIYLEPSCVNGHKVIDLYLNNGKNIRSFSNEQVGTAGWGDLKVQSACPDQNISFTITPTYDIPGIGSVSPSDNRANIIILRNNRSEIIAQATKRLVQEGSSCKAIWEVTNNAGLSPQVMSYLLALKDNALFTCDTSAPAPASSGISTIAIVTIAVATSLGITVGAFCIYRWVQLHRPHWLKLESK